MEIRESVRGRIRALAAAAAALALAVVVGALAPQPAHADETNGLDVSKSKTATNLDENYESEVTLSLPAADYKGNIDVVFVLDGSTSSDQSGLAGQAAALLEKIAGYENLDVKAGVVVFGGTVPILENTGLRDLADEGELDRLTSMLVDPSYDKKEGRSGSNLQAGVEVGRQALAEDKGVDDRDKYLIVLSDGGARMWYDSESGEAIGKLYQYGGGYWGASNNDYLYRYGHKADHISAQVDTPRTFDEVWSATEDAVDAYSAWSSEKDAELKAGNYQTDVGASDYYPSYEAATYHAAKSLVVASSESNVVFVSYPYYEGSGENYTSFIEGFKDWLNDNVNLTMYKTMYKNNNNGVDPEVVFGSIEDELIQVVDAGSQVIDVMGQTDEYDFDFVNDRMTLTVGGVELAKEQINDDTYGFGPDESLDGGYQFVLTYYPESVDEGECFEWDINVPVVKNVPVQLSYVVKLTNPSKIPGEYGFFDADGSKGYEGLYTNNSAVLYPVNSRHEDGNWEEFPQPTVSYTVEEAEPQPSDDPAVGSGDPADSGDSAASTPAGGKEKVAMKEPVRKASLAQTGDPLAIAVPAVALTALAAAACVAVAAFARRRSQR